MYDGLVFDADTLGTTMFGMTSRCQAFGRPKFCMTFCCQSVRKTKFLYDFLLWERLENQGFLWLSVGNAFGRSRFCKASCCKGVCYALWLFILVFLGLTYIIWPLFIAFILWYPTSLSEYKGDGMFLVLRVLQLYALNVDIKFSAHDASLEKPSSVTLKVESNSVLAIS